MLSRRAAGFLVAAFVVTFALNLWGIVKNNRAEVFTQLPEYMEYTESYGGVYSIMLYRKGLKYYIKYEGETFELSRREYAWCTKICREQKIYGYEHWFNGKDIVHFKAISCEDELLIFYAVPAKHKYRAFEINGIDPAVRRDFIRDARIMLITDGKIAGLPGSYMGSKVRVLCLVETLGLAAGVMMFSRKKI